MKCPSCGSDEAYFGFNSIDCPTQGCKHFQGGAVALDNSAPPIVPSGHANRFPNPTGPVGVWGNPVAAPALNIQISRVFPRQNNVQISFIASGDAGSPDKDVEIYFDIGNGEQLCTLSHPNVTHISGVDADGTTIYSTNWLCLQDGVKPTDSFQLKAVIY